MFWCYYISLPGMKEKAKPSEKVSFITPSIHLREINSINYILD